MLNNYSKLLISYSSGKTIPTILTKVKKLFQGENQIFFDLKRTQLYNDEPQFFHYRCAFRTGNIIRVGAGSSFAKENAITTCIGESIERYSLLRTPLKSFKKNSFSVLGDQAIDPTKFVAFDLRQSFVKKEERFQISNNNKFYWVKASSWFDRKEVYIPAQLVYLYDPNDYGEKIIQFPLSTGAAAGSSTTHALYRAICEAIERDAFLINYLNKLQGQPLLQTKGGVLNEIINKINRYKLSVSLIKFYSDAPINCVGSIIIDDTSFQPQIVLGMSADADIERAAISATMEACRVRGLVRDWLQEGLSSISKKAIDSLQYHNKKRAFIWSRKESLIKIKFLLKGKPHFIKNTDVKQKTSEQSLKKILDWLNKMNYHLYVVDITAPRIRNTGIKVLKVIIPELVPLYLNEEYPYLGVKRLYDMPKSLNILKKTKNMSSLNKFPHPFL